MKPSHITSLKVITIILVVLLLLGSGLEAITNRMTTYENIDGNIQIRYPYIYYLITLILGVVSIMVIPFISSNVFRILLSALLSLCVAANYVAHDILGDALSFQMFQVFISSVEETALVFAEYYVSILTGFVLFLCVFIVSALKPTATLPWLLKTAWWLPIGAILITGHAFRYSNNYLEEFAAPVIMPAQLFYAFTKSADGNVPKDKPYQYDLATEGIEKIVLIVDESVRGDFLQINQTIFDNTPYLASIEDRFANFGISAAYANCSSKTRLALRVGLLNSEVPIQSEDLFSKSTFWQYAQLAGYETVFIDGWQPLRSNHSGFGKFEENYVDKRINAEVKPFNTIDSRLAELLKEELGKPGKQFIFVEKIGLHAPYDQNIPEGATYVPSKTSVPNTEISENRQRKIREYSQGIKNRVDDFFKILLDKNQLKNSLVIYTSDHGQTLFQARYKATHCTNTKKTHWSEGAVPLLVFTDDEASLANYRQAAVRSYNKTQHEGIFPALLTAMGFDGKQVQKNYGEPFLEKTYTESPSFIIGDLNTDRNRAIVIPEDASPIGLVPRKN